MDPHALAVTAMRTRHLKRFGELEAEREDIGRTLATLAKQNTQETGGDPGLLDRLPMLGDLLAAAPDRIKQKLVDAFDIQALYSKAHNQVTFWAATITPATPAALAAITADSETPELAALLITFTQLTAGEEMPARMTLRARSRRAVRAARQQRGRATRAYQRACLRYALLVWFLLTATIIGAAVALSRGDVHAACPRSWWAACASQVPSSSAPFTA